MHWKSFCHHSVWFLNCSIDSPGSPASLPYCFNNKASLSSSSSFSMMCWGKMVQILLEERKVKGWVSGKKATEDSLAPLWKCLRSDTCTCACIDSRRRSHNRMPEIKYEPSPSLSKASLGLLIWMGIVPESAMIFWASLASTQLEQLLKGDSILQTSYLIQCKTPEEVYPVTSIMTTSNHWIW